METENDNSYQYDATRLCVEPSRISKMFKCYHRQLTRCRVKMFVHIVCDGGELNDNIIDNVKSNVMEKFCIKIMKAKPNRSYDHENHLKITFQI